MDVLRKKTDILQVVVYIYPPRFSGLLTDKVVKKDAPDRRIDRIDG